MDADTFVTLILLKSSLGYVFVLVLRVNVNGCVQCDQMATLFFTIWPFYMNVNLPNGIQNLPK